MLLDSNTTIVSINPELICAITTTLTHSNTTIVSINLTMIAFSPSYLLIQIQLLFLLIAYQQAVGQAKANSNTTIVSINLLLGIGYLLTYMHSNTTIVSINPMV